MTSLCLILSFLLISDSISKSLEPCDCPERNCVCVDQELCYNGYVIKGVVSDGAPANKTPTGLCPWGLTCCMLEVHTLQRRQAINTDLVDSCGLRTVPPTNKGYATEDGEFPWMVKIYIWNQEANAYGLLCGGAIIHPQVVVTAANCTPSFDADIVVYAGSNEGQNGNWRGVMKIKSHDYYNDETGEYDIALLYLDSPFVLDDTTRVLCLPQPDTRVITDGCIAAGYSGGSGQISSTLRQTKMEIQKDVDECIEMLTDFEKDKYSFLEHTIFCAISRDRTSICEVDEGRPLVCPMQSEPSRYVLIGVTSLALGCQDPRAPVFYTNTTYLATWIHVQLALIGVENYAVPPL